MCLILKEIQLTPDFKEEHAKAAIKCIPFNQLNT